MAIFPQWRDVQANFGSSNQAMANAQRGIGGMSDTASTILNQQLQQDASARQEQQLKLQQDANARADQQLKMQQREEQFKVDSRAEAAKYLKNINSATQPGLLGIDDQTKLGQTVAAIGQQAAEGKISPEEAQRQQKAYVDSVLPSMQKSFAAQGPKGTVGLMNSIGYDATKIDPLVASTLLDKVQQPYEKAIDRKDQLDNHMAVLKEQNAKAIALQNLANQQAVDLENLRNTNAIGKETFYDPKTGTSLSGRELLKLPTAEQNKYITSTGAMQLATLGKTDPYRDKVFFAVNADGDISGTGAMPYAQAAAYVKSNPDTKLYDSSTYEKEFGGGGHSGGSGSGGKKGGGGAGGAEAAITDNSDLWDRIGTGDAQTALKTTKWLLATGISDSDVKKAQNTSALKGSGLFRDRTFRPGDVDEQGLTIKAKDGTTVPAGTYITAAEQMGATLQLDKKGGYSLAFPKKPDGTEVTQQDIIKKIKDDEKLSVMNALMGKSSAVLPPVSSTVTDPVLEDMISRQQGIVGTPKPILPQSNTPYTPILPDAGIKDVSQEEIDNLNAMLAQRNANNTKATNLPRLLQGNPLR